MKKSGVCSLTFVNFDRDVRVILKYNHFNFQFTTFFICYTHSETIYLTQKCLGHKFVIYLFDIKHKKLINEK